MTRSIPPDVLAKIREHEHWLETLREEGQKLVLIGADLRDVDLSNYDLAYAALEDVFFDRALLYAADLSVTEFYNVSFVEAKMDDAKMIQVEASNANFSKASLRRVQAISAEFYEANLFNVNLEGSNLYDVDLQKTNLEGANLSHVNLHKASLRNASLKHAIFTGAQVGSTTFIDATGVETVEVEWLDIGSKGAPQRIESEQAKVWLLQAVAKRTNSDKAN